MRCNKDLTYISFGYMMEEKPIRSIFFRFHSNTKKTTHQPLIRTLVHVTMSLLRGHNRLGEKCGIKGILNLKMQSSSDK